MIFTDIFIWLFYKGVYLGQTINFGAYYACFDQSLTFTRSVANIRECMANLSFRNTFSTGFVNGNLLERMLSLSDATRLRIDSVDVYGKYDGGETQKMSFSIGQLGTRVAGLSGGLPPSTTINIKASSEVYRQKGANRGLWGVDESDQVDGIISSSSVVYTAANNVAAWMSQTQNIDGVVDSYDFDTCTVKRINYITPDGEQASRLPLETADVPSCYKLGTWGVSLNTGNNKKRRLKTGGR